MNEKRLRLSPCCHANIGASLADGVLVGHCTQCHKDLCRVNPRTGAREWLDGESPWSTRDDLRKMQPLPRTTLN